MDGLSYLCINLERSPERRAQMEAEAAEQGINIEFVRAVDKLDLTVDSVPEYNRRRRIATGLDLSTGEIACALSHRKALGQFLASSAKAAVILEDDARLLPSFRAFVEAVVSLPVAWDAVTLENRNQNPLRPALFTLGDEIGLYATASASRGGAAWLYSRAGAEKLYPSLAWFHCAFDTHIGYFWRYNMEVFCAFPPVVEHKISPSTIKDVRAPVWATRGKQTPLQWAKWRTERFEHGVRKKIAARLTYKRMRRRLVDAGLAT